MRLGPYEIELVSDGRYRLDGGAMFGVVPKPLWERQHPADERNRVQLGLNCLLLRSDERIVLVDTGMGTGWSEKDVGIYGLERPHGGLLEALDQRGVQPEDVTDVILTHLHFDHAGGCTRADDLGRVLTFPRATHWLQSSHLRWGSDPTDRDRGSFRHDDLQFLLADKTRFSLLDGSGEILPAVEVHVVSGHTPGQQVVLIGEPDGPRLLHAADLIPFASHVHVPWIMAFDLNPLLTLEEKREWLARCAHERWPVVFGHGVDRVAGLVGFEDGRYRVVEEVVI